VRAAAFSADGRAAYLVTDREGDFNELYALDLGREGAGPRPLSRAVRWDVEELAVARDGSRVAFAVNAGGWSEVWLLDPRSGALRKADVGRAVVSRLRFPDRRSGTLFLAMQHGRGPTDVYALDVAKGKLERWTRSEVGGLDPSAFVAPEMVRYPSTGGVDVPAFLYRPPERFGGRRPVVVIWHGGPEGQSRPTFSPFVQFLAVEEGFAVLAPNVRGSDGYGKGYLAMDDGPRREQALADIGATLDFVATRADLDPGRVAVYGGSYGGYMTLATAAFFPGRIRAAVDVVGISSLPSFLEHTQAYRRDLRRAEYGDERDPAVRAVQERISPLGAVDRITAALLVQQGKNDPRVPQSEAEQIVNALRARGRPVSYLLALDEGHGFQKKDNRDAAVAAAVMFLERELSGPAASQTGASSGAR
jgi:dipeptidyl aminopeptidase/acylaminoacyl peptidase